MTSILSRALSALAALSLALAPAVVSAQPAIDGGARAQAAQALAKASGAVPSNTPIVITGDGLDISLGSNTRSNDDSSIVVHRKSSNSLGNGGSHGVRDESTYIPLAGASGGYASFDCNPVIGGSLAASFNHARCGQARQELNYQGTIPEASGWWVGMKVDAGTTVTDVYGVTLTDTVVQSGGQVGQQQTVACQQLAAASSNFCIYNFGNNPNFLGNGTTQIGGQLQLPASYSTYGAILGHDASGFLLDNPFLTIVNGVLTMSSPLASKINATAALLELSAPSASPIQIDNPIVSSGATPTLTGTCTTSAKLGGQFAGKFQATCTSGTVIMTFATAAPNGWYCAANDISTSADTLKQTSYNTTSCTLTGTTVASDTITFIASGF